MMMTKAQEGKPDHTNTVYASAYITSANTPLARANHLAKPNLNWIVGQAPPPKNGKLVHFWYRK